MAVTAWGQVYIQATAPGEDPVQVGSLWVDTSGTATLKICTSISPYTFSAITGGGGAPTDADYLVKTANGDLSAERVVTDSTSIAADWSVAGQVALKRAALTGDVTASADGNATTIANGAVTEAKQTLADNTTHNASTTAHGYAPKATAPVAGLLSVLGIGNGETVRSDKAIFDTTNPAALGTAAPGTALVAARRDHIHAFPKLDDLAAPDDNTDLNASPTAHGLLPKLSNVATEFLNGQGVFSAPAGVMTLVGQAEGTDTTAAATNVATIAISGLTVKDTLWVLLWHESVTQQTAQPVLYNNTDGVIVQEVEGAALAAGVHSAGQWLIGAHQSGNTVIHSFGIRAMDLVTPTLRQTEATFTTTFTGNWSLTLRTGTGGVTAGGTYKFRLKVYKLAGQ